VAGFVDGWSIFLYRLAGGICGFGVVFLIRQFGFGIQFLYRRLGLKVSQEDAMGLGDVIMCTGIGLLLGWDMFLIFFFSYPFFGLFYLLLLRLRGYKRKLIPTGPAYFFPFLICLCYSEQILSIFSKLRPM